MYVLTVYPFDNNNSAKYEPSWPVIPVINATFDSVDDLSVMVVMKRMVILLYERERERESGKQDQRFLCWRKTTRELKYYTGLKLTDHIIRKEPPYIEVALVPNNNNDDECLYHIAKIIHTK